MPHTPFSISPLPSALFVTPKLKAAIHRINYVVEQRQGLTCLLGDPGIGKSSILRRVAGDLAALPGMKIVFIEGPEISSVYAFVRSICASFGIGPKRSTSHQREALRDYAWEQAKVGGNVVILVDEAQTLPLPFFETIRGFLNFETNTAKMIQVVLAGQLELRKKLNDTGNRAIRSRVVMASLLDPLTREEMDQMLRFRCQLYDLEFPFEEAAEDQIFEWSLGIPRDTLRLCATAYEFAQVIGAERINAELIGHAIAQEERAIPNAS